MFHRKVKSDLPSIPLSLFDSISAGHRSMKHAERMNESENRGEPPRLEQHQTVMFMKKLRKEDPMVKWDSCHCGWSTIISCGRQDNWNTIFQRPSPHQANSR